MADLVRSVWHPVGIAESTTPPTYLYAIADDVVGVVELAIARGVTKVAVVWSAQGVAESVFGSGAQRVVTVVDVVAIPESITPVGPRFSRLTEAIGVSETAVVVLAPAEVPFDASQRDDLPGILALMVADLPPLTDDDIADPRIVVGAARSSDRSLWSPPVRVHEQSGQAHAITYLTDEAIMGDVLDWSLIPPVRDQWDEASTITVRPGVGALESVTAEEVLGGANRIALGYGELLGFRTATASTLYGTTVYTLSGLLRGIRGSDFWAPEADPPVWMLLSDVGPVSVRWPWSSLDTSRAISATPRGLDPVEADERVTVTTAGANLRPRSPADVDAVLNGSDWDVSWVRVNRAPGASILAPRQPDDPDPIAYRVDVWTSPTDPTPIRSTDVTTDAWTYTAAQQTTDFGGPVSQVALSVYRVSGWGDSPAATAVLPIAP